MNFGATASAPSTSSYLGIMAQASQASAAAGYKYSPAYYVYQLTGHTQPYWGVAQMIANFGGDASKLTDVWPVPKEYPGSSAAGATLAQGQAYNSNSMQAQGYLTTDWSSQLGQNTLLYELKEFCLVPTPGFQAANYFTAQELQWLGQIQHYYANGGSDIYIPPWPPSDATAMTTNPAMAAPSVSPSTQAGNPTAVNTKLPLAHPASQSSLSLPLLLGVAVIGFFALRKG